MRVCGQDGSKEKTEEDGRIRADFSISLTRIILFRPLTSHTLIIPSNECEY